LALINILTSSGADVATITECEIPEGSWEFSVAGYTTFSPSPSLQGGKTQVLILIKNDLAVRANVKVIKDIMDPAVQSVWLHLSHHRIGSGSSTLGAFIQGGINREWTPLLSREESRLCLGALLDQISKAADGSRVVIHGDFNVDLDQVDDACQVPRRVHGYSRHGNAHHVNDLLVVWQLYPTSGGRPLTSARRRRKSCRRWATSRRRFAKSGRRWTKSGKRLDKSGS
jgi:hypothetical protein